MTDARVKQPKAALEPFWPQHIGSINREINRAVGKTVRALQAAESSTSVTPALVEDDGGDWAIPVEVGQKLRVRVIATYQTAATTTGGKLNITASSAAGSINGRATGAIDASAAVATDLVLTIGALPFTLTTTAVSAIDTPHHIGMEFVFVCTTAGSLEIRWGSEVASSAAQLNAGSMLIWEVLQ